jgi:DNA-binding response OmpR family regulator
MDKEGKKVLVISSEIELAELVKNVLMKERNDEVTTSIGGHQGLLVAGQDHPDLIFLEVMMSGLDGWEVLKRLREHEALRQIPVLFTLALSPQKAYPLVRQAGGTGYICWPAAPQEILAARDAALRGTNYYPKPEGCLALILALVRDIYHAPFAGRD